MELKHKKLSFHPRFFSFAFKKTFICLLMGLSIIFFYCMIYAVLCISFIPISAIPCDDVVQCCNVSS
jgi:hypothetical protein